MCFTVNLYALLQTPKQVMAQATPAIVLVAALLISTLSRCTAENVCCVTPTATSWSSCPHNSTHNATLSEYAQEVELYFTSNTTMVFLPGDHVLDMNITVANVTRLTMRGESSSGNIAIIVCSRSVGLSFKNMAELKIDSLVFTSCGRDSASPSASKYALLLELIAHAELVTCSFHNNNGTTNRTSLGGAIYVSQKTVLNFSGTNNFINNSAEDGGAIYVSHNTRVSFSENSNFINNSAARDGGAIYASHNTRVSFSGNSNLINNSAARNGGAIYASHNTQVSFSGTSNFTNNVAARDGARGNPRITQYSS